MELTLLIIRWLFTLAVIFGGLRICIVYQKGKSLKVMKNEVRLFVLSFLILFLLSLYMGYVQWDTVIFALPAFVAIFFCCRICRSRRKDTPWKNLKSELSFLGITLIIIWFINIYNGYIR